MKKIVAMVLAAVLLLALAACGRLDKDGTYYMVNTFFFDDTKLKELTKQVEQMPWTLDAQQVYANLTYNEKMFYGEYLLADGKSGHKAFMKDASFMELECAIGTMEEGYDSYTDLRVLSSLPIGLMAGDSSVYEARGNDDHEWAKLSFADSDGYTRYVFCTYTVQGDQITFTPLDGYEVLYDENYNRIGLDYILGEDSLTYTFAFSGAGLTLRNDSGSVTLYSRYFSNNGLKSVRLGGYLAADSASLEGIDNFCAQMYDRKDCFTYFETQDESLYITKEAVVFRQDGLCRFYWVSRDADGNETEHNIELVCFPGDGYASVLTDGENVYYYTDSYTTRELATLTQIVAEEDQGLLNEMEEEQIKKIVEKKANLLEDLAAAYEAAGMNVAINTQTGEIALDASVLFGVDESAISADGKSFLQQFMQIYTSVVFSEEYADFVSSIMVEGHTDTSGSYEMNQELSQARADSVRDYCLSSECGVDAYTEALKQMLVAQGYSYDKPIYDAEGNVDMDASRRVSFRFIINLEDQVA